MEKKIKSYRNKVKSSFIVINEKGLHTRPSTELVKCAVNFKSKINLLHQNTIVDAKSLLGILALAAGKGTKINIEATGEDSKQAINAIIKLAGNKFNINY